MKGEDEEWGDWSFATWDTQDMKLGVKELEHELSSLVKEACALSMRTEKGCFFNF